MHFPQKVAVIGAGMTKFMRRAKETGKELAFLAAKMALLDAGLEIDDIDAVVCVSAPDAFDGVHMKGEYLSDGAGAFCKPYMRSYVGGGSGVFAIINGWYHIASGYFKTCLVVAEEKMSSSMPHPQGIFNAIYDQFLERPLGVNLLWIFSLEMNRYMSVHKIPLETIALVAVKNKKNGLDHPCAQEGIPGNYTVEEIVNSEIMCWPVTRLMVSPVTDGAAAIVLASEDFVKKRYKDPVWIEGVGWHLDTSYWTNRDLYYPRYVEYAARMAYDMAGIKDPRKEIHVVEPYDPFAYKELHHLEGLLLADKGEAPKLLEKGFWDRDTLNGIPSSPSGGLLGVGNPIAAAGLMKVIEIYWQLKGMAGKRQVKKEVKRGLAQAWGDLMQVGTVVILGK
ncbi:MAG: thiolase domain-containing protein [candidate division WOR-3 bacterium]|uniref:Thiolase domain-containing protein n=1 Tax=candidate division WOR-3 bacterium TaxID=2052148 RepID=A0A7V3ZTN7_UNCW3